MGCSSTEGTMNRTHIAVHAVHTVQTSCRLPPVAAHSAVTSTPVALAIHLASCRQYRLAADHTAHQLVENLYLVPRTR
jgi:hypothetical protein